MMLPPPSRKGKEHAPAAPARKRERLSNPAPMLILQVKLFATTSRGAEYKGRIQINPVKTGTTSIDPKDIGTDLASDDTAVVYAINPGEVGSAGHTLKTDGSVIVSVMIISYADDGKPITLMLSAGNQSTRVRAVSNAAGGGKYYGYVVTNPVGVLASGNLAETDLAGNSTFTAGDLGVNVPKVLIFNGYERGQSTHILTDTTAGPIVTDIFAGIYLGMSGDATPLPVYAINDFDPYFCTLGS